MKFFYKLFVFLIVVFLVAFPKGGFKVGDIPITWGYILIILVGIISAFSIKKINYFTKSRYKVLALCLPFILYAIIILLLSEVPNKGVLFSFILGVFIFPLLFLYLLGKDIDDPKFNDSFLPIFKNSIRFIAFFGIALFIYKIKTGNDIEIPYLTVNFSDVGSLDDKYNLRGDLSKLISTYNNGNIYGICMLILLPIYLNIEKSLTLKIVFFLSMILTLSRTVWVGLLLYLILYVISQIKTAKSWGLLIFTLLIVYGGGNLFLNFIGKDTNFLFDSQLGGRADQLNVLDNLTFFGDFNFDTITEIVYTSILKHFGLLGLLLFILYLMSPIIYYYRLKISNKDNGSFVSIHWSIIIYALICFSDGAILLIPVMAFFWFVSSYMFKQYTQIK
ncbi:hypothetical protein [Mucilaginibacter sp.]